MRDKNKSKNISISKIFIVCDITILILGILFYNLIPILLNYGPEVINSYFETQIDSGWYYYIQFIIILVLILFLMNLVVFFQIKGIYNWNKADSAIELEKVQNKCFKIPYEIYVFQLLVIPSIVALILLITGTDFLMLIKIFSLVFAFSTLVSILTYIFTKNVFKKILILSNNPKMRYKKFRFTLKAKIFFQILPLFIVTVLFIALFGYSALIDEKGDMLFNEYTSLLSTEFSNEVYSEEEIIEKITKVKKIDNTSNFFVLNEYDEIFNTGEELSDFFIKYVNIVAHKYNGHAYDYYGSDIQGTVKYITGENGQNYIAGVIYNLASENILMFMGSSIVVMMIICIVYLLYFSSDISSEVKEVSKNLLQIVEKNEIDFDKKLSVTSNDEIGELVVAFNKILELEKNNIATLERNQEIMVEQERLSSLGQLIGGIAHNLKTPIMSIAGVLEGITDLIDEYDESIEDPNVTKEDHHEIANDMRGWIEKVKPYLSYMTEIIDAVKGQAVSMNASTMKYFTVKELVLRIQLLMKNELKRRHCTLNLDNIVDESTSISGEISAIIQVIDNMIINSMDAYKDAPGSIDIMIKEDEVKVYIDVKDYAGGIPKNVQEKLFNEMVTSKGKNGTGLGLYMSFSTIKGKFKGDIKYETEEDKGTTFFIELPKYRPGMENKEEEGEEEE